MERWREGEMERGREGERSKAKETKSRQNKSGSRISPQFRARLTIVKVHIILLFRAPF